MQREERPNVNARVINMAVLLGLLVLDVFVLPFAVASDSVLARLMRDLLLSLILLSGATTASGHRRIFAIIAAVAIGAILLRWTEWIFPAVRAPELVDESAFAALGVLSVVIGIHVFGRGTVTLERLLGAVVFYVMVGVVWAEAYRLVSLHTHGAFTGLPADAAQIGHSTWIYFSFVTLTTVGYGDITPLGPMARSLAILEALIGQLYPAIVLARLVSLHAAGSTADSNGNGQPR
jgi:hypothetical protein